MGFLSKKKVQSDGFSTINLNKHASTLKLVYDLANYFYKSNEKSVKFDKKKHVNCRSCSYNYTNQVFEDHADACNFQSDYQSKELAKVLCNWAFIHGKRAVPIGKVNVLVTQLADSSPVPTDDKTSKCNKCGWHFDEALFNEHKQKCLELEVLDVKVACKLAAFVKWHVFRHEKIDTELARKALSYDLPLILASNYEKVIAFPDDLAEGVQCFWKLGLLTVKATQAKPTIFCDRCNSFYNVRDKNEHEKLCKLIDPHVAERIGTIFSAHRENIEVLSLLKSLLPRLNFTQKDCFKCNCDFSFSVEAQLENHRKLCNLFRKSSSLLGVFLSNEAVFVAKRLKTNSQILPEQDNSEPTHQTFLADLKVISICDNIQLICNLARTFPLATVFETSKNTRFCKKCKFFFSNTFYTLHSSECKKNKKVSTESIVTAVNVYKTTFGIFKYASITLTQLVKQKRTEQCPVNGCGIVLQSDDLDIHLRTCISINAVARRAVFDIVNDGTLLAVTDKALENNKFYPSLPKLDKDDKTLPSISKQDNQPLSDQIISTSHGKDVKIYSWDVLDNPNEYLQNDLIDAYFQLIENFHNESSECDVERIPAEIFYCWNDPNLKQVIDNYSIEERIFGKFLMPICLAQFNLNHWTLMIIDCENEMMTYYDSSFADNNPNYSNIVDTVFENVADFFESKSIYVKSYSKMTVKSPRQQDAVNCGLFISFFALHFAMGWPMTFPNVPDIRALMKKELVMQKILDKEHCLDSYVDNENEVQPMITESEYQDDDSEIFSDTSSVSNYSVISKSSTIASTKRKLGDTSLNKNNLLEHKNSKKPVNWCADWDDDFEIPDIIPPQPISQLKKSASESDEVRFKYCLTNKNSLAFNKKKLLSEDLSNVTPLGKSVLMETRVIMSSHHVLYSMMTCKKTLESTLRLYYVILERIQTVRTCSELEAFVYSMFTELPNDKSFFVFLYFLIYIGKSTHKENKRNKNSDTLRRDRQHERAAKKSTEEGKHKLPKLYSYIGSCWNASVKVFKQNMFENLTEKQSLFAEHAMITFASNFIQNCNSQQEGLMFEKAMEKMSISRETIVKIGCALLVKFHKSFTNNFECYEIQRSDFTLNSKEYTEMITMFNELEVPKFSLLEEIEVESKHSKHSKYALYLFMALFTIRGRLANWFIQRPNCAELINELDAKEFLEISSTINSLLALSKCNIDDCVKWAFDIWFRVFVTNVEVANTELIKLRRANRFKANIHEMYKMNIDFISSAAEILALMIGLSGVTKENIKTRSEIHYKANYQKRIPTLRYKNTEKFMDLILDVTNEEMDHAKRKFLSTAVHQGKRITVIEPTSENEIVKKFLASATRIRYFNFTNSLNINSSLLHNFHRKKIPVFPASHLFLNIY